MAKKKTEEEKALSNDVGRPTAYKESYNIQAYKLCLLGATDKEIAEFFEVTETTINNWKITYPEFFESIREGKRKSDMEVVNALYYTTQDREIVEQQAIKCKEVIYEGGKKIKEVENVVMVDVMRIIPADFRSQQFWLKNRKSDTWRDKQEIDHSGEMTVHQITGMEIK